MQRRDFLKYSLATLALANLNPNTLFANDAESKPIIVNLILDGGADFRHILSPIFSEDKSSYGFNFWKNRASSHNLDENDLTALKIRSDEYLKIDSDSVSFGVNPKASWLKEQFDMKNVAIVNNVLNSNNRDHSHSLLKLESGDNLAGSHDFERSGWGGRVAKESGENILSLTRNVRLFCNAPDGSDFLNHKNDIVISASDSRNIGLYEYDTQADIDAGERRYRWNYKAIMSRSLSSYYEAKKDLISENSPYYKSIQHQRNLLQFGRAINQKLADIPEPESLTELYDSKSEFKLNSSYFGKQLRNLYDCLICQDVLNMRVASLEYGGWDSHKRQIDSIEGNIEDIFGADRGLDRVMSEIKKAMPSIAKDLVFVISSEFGRQLSSNGDNGTDHGRGSSILIVGDRVNGGVYGDMFPDSEIDRFAIANEDIKGLTSIDLVLSKVCDEVKAESGKKIFDLSDSIVEDGVDLNKIFG